MRRLFAGLALLAVGVTGCGSSNMLAPAGAPDAAAAIAAQNVRGNFFPLNSGRYLGFSPSTADLVSPSGPDYTFDVRGPAPQWGAGVMEVLDSETRAYMSTDKGGVYLKALADGPNGTAQKLPRPVRFLTYPLRVGRFWTDNYGAGDTSIHVRHWIADLVTVHTPRGIFRAFQIERQVWRGRRQPAVGDDGLGRSNAYYAQNIGPVQIGVRWPGITLTTYQLSSMERPTLIQSEPAPPAAGPWHGLSAGLEALIRN
jgi:hypothetical protein